jgi:hypothetical protein
LGVGQQPGEVERAHRRQHRVVVAVDDQDGLVHVGQHLDDDVGSCHLVVADRA